MVKINGKNFPQHHGPRFGHFYYQTGQQKVIFWTCCISYGSLVSPCTPPPPLRKRMVSQYYWRLCFQKISLLASKLTWELCMQQGSQIRQNCSDDSTEVTKGVNLTPEIFSNKQGAISTPEIFGNKHSYVLTFFTTKLIQFTLIVNAGLLIFCAVADLRNSGISAKSREIPKKMWNTTKSARNISKYMSTKHI